MARVVEQPRVEVKATIELSESELRALEALVGYGTDPFIDVFYHQLGKTYLSPHEAGLRSLFSSIRETVPQILNRADKARQAFTAKQEKQA